MEAHGFILPSPPPLSAELHSTSCGNPGVPAKAVLSGGNRFAVGDSVQYSCVPGYVLDGHATLTCITNAGNTAVWDFPAPICRGTALSVRLLGCRGGRERLAGRYLAAS